MANQADIDRWKQGRKQWNHWAEEQIQARQLLEESDEWSRHADDWRKRNAVDFRNHQFNSLADFTGFVFPGSAIFDGAKFSAGANFVNTRFVSGGAFRNCVFHSTAQFAETSFEEGDGIFAQATFVGMGNFVDVRFGRDANFNGAKFQRSVSFANVIFSGGAKFVDAQFDTKSDQGSGPRSVFAASFSNVKLCQAAEFQRAHFQHIVKITDTTFRGEANFRSIRSDVGLIFEDTDFERAPDLAEARFSAPPQLDHVGILEAPAFQLKGCKDRAGQYRALKSLATQIQDNSRELDFFASEIRERRGNDDPVLSARYVFGFAYELFSDFGRSVGRPILWLIISSTAFAFLYGNAEQENHRRNCQWQSDWLAPEWYLSLLHSLPIIGFGKGSMRDEALRCIFGEGENGATLVSPWMDIAFIGQNIGSAALIFFLLLALRNRFKIS